MPSKGVYTNNIDEYVLGIRYPPMYPPTCHPACQPLCRDYFSSDSLIRSEVSHPRSRTTTIQALPCPDKRKLVATEYAKPLTVPLIIHYIRG